MKLQDVKHWVKNEATEGELIHLVNSIYKHHEIVPTKVRHLMLNAVAEMTGSKFEYGQKVVQVIDGSDGNVNDVPAGTKGTVVKIDEEDPLLRYKVDFGLDVGREWTREDMLVTDYDWHHGW